MKNDDAQTKEKHHAFKHGLHGTRQYQVWKDIKKRCNDKKNIRYYNYGGRDICYDKKWESFIGFWEDMAEGYDDKLTIDRIDNDGDYCKENCKWATTQEQANNRTSNRFVFYKGIKYTLAQLAESEKISYKLLHSRITVGGLTIKQALCKKHKMV